jgi:hypothetical protein
MYVLPAEVVAVLPVQDEPEVPEPPQPVQLLPPPPSSR